MLLHQNIVPLSTRFFSLKWPDESTTTPGNYRTIAWKVKKTKTKQSRQKDEFIKKKNRLTQGNYYSTIARNLKIIIIKN